MKRSQYKFASAAGKELEIFANAHNWKRYMSTRLRSYIKGNVLEVGAGAGNTSLALCKGTEDSWLCLEPDKRLASEINSKIAKRVLPLICRLYIGNISDIRSTERFDTILYIDVLEHIEDDTGELAAAAKILAPGGELIVLAPAWHILYSPFDAAIGHFRRYNRQQLERLTPQSLSVKSSFYLDSAGLLASATNRIRLKSSMPTLQQIMIWDRFLVPVSRWVDPLTCHRLGKSVVTIWTKG